ncbi:hypothetical protein [Paracoccus niistensis]|uniref:Uncharacterized protein n=1 Tax=Paracoccus niistensis TaxID=632935 RepID=A0ABV6I1P8_9RHOB
MPCIPRLLHFTGDWLGPVWRNAVGVLLFIVTLPASAISRDWTTVWVNPDENVDVYTQVNMSGEVHVASDVNGSPACVDYWWITWPFGRVQQLGRHCGRASFEIPGWSSLAISSRLRAGGAESRTRIQGSAIEEIAKNFPEINF